MAYPPKKTVDRFDRALEETKKSKDFSLNTDYIEGSIEGKNEEGFVQGDSHLDDLRGENQSFTDKAINGLTKFVAKTGIRALDGIATLPYMLGLGMLQGEDSYLKSVYNNPISRDLGEITESLNQALPNYQTDEEKNNLASSVMSANFLFDKVLDGASYALAAYLTGSGMSKILGGASKLISTSKGVNAVEQTIGDLPNLLKNANLAKAGQGANKIASAIFSGTVESSAEARETYDNVLNKLTEKKLREKQGESLTEFEQQQINDDATSAANASFLINSVITSGTNYLEFGKSFSSSFKDDALKLVEKRAVQELDDAGKATGKLIDKELTKSQKLLKTVSKYGESPLEEAFQEGSQTFTNAFLTDYYANDDTSTRDLIESLGKGMHETFGTKDGIESMILGAVIGAGASALTNKGKSKEEQERLDAVLESYNSNNISNSTKELIKSASKSEAINQRKNKAVENGDIFEYKTLEAAGFHNVVQSRIDAGKFDEFKDFAEGIKEMTDEEFKAEYGTESSSFNKNKFADEYLAKANAINKNYENLKANYGHEVSKDSLGKMAFTLSMVDDLKTRETQVIENLKEFGYDYNAEVVDKFVNNATIQERTELSKELSKSIINKQGLVSELSGKLTKNEFKDDELIAKKAELINLTKELSDLSNQQIEIADLMQYSVNNGKLFRNTKTKEGKDEIVQIDYLNLNNQFSNNVKNTLKESELRKFAKNDIDPTKRTEFEKLIKDLNRIQKVKNEFIDLHNQFKNPKFVEETNKINNIIAEKKYNNAIKKDFTIKVKSVVKNEDDSVSTKQTDLFLENGLYNLKDIIVTKISDTEFKKQNSNRNKILEIHNRKIENGEGFVEISIDGNEKEWININTLSNKNIQKKYNNELSDNEVFYSLYKDRLIEYRYYDVNSSASKINDKYVNVKGFLGFDSFGNLILRHYNDKGNFVILKIDNKDNENIKTSSQKFEITGVSKDGKLSYPKGYTKIYSEEETSKYLDVLTYEKRIDNLKNKINTIENSENKEDASIKILTEDLIDVQKTIDKNIKKLGRLKNQKNIEILKSQIDSLTKSIENINKQIEDNKDLILKHKQQLAFIEQQFANKVPISELRKAHDEIRLDVEQTKSEILNELTDYVKDFEIKNSVLLEQQQILNDGLDDLKDKFAQIIIELDLLNGDNIIKFAKENNFDLENSTNKEKVDFIFNNNIDTVVDLLPDIKDQIALELLISLNQRIGDNYAELKNEIDLILKNEYQNFNIDNPLSNDLIYQNKVDMMKNLYTTVSIYDKLLADATKEDYTIQEEFVNPYISHINNISNPNEDTYNGGNIAPSVDHNGNIPFRKTTYGNVKLEDITDNSNDSEELKKQKKNNKSNFVLNKVIQNEDIASGEYLIEYSLSLPDDYKNYQGDGSEADTAIYTIVTDSSGKRLLYDINGTQKETGYLASSVLPTENPTSNTNGTEYNKFYDWETLTDAQKEQFIEEHKTFRKTILDKLKNGEKIYSEISDKSLGIRNITDKKSLLNDIVTITDLYKESDNRTQSIEIADDNFITVKGKQYPTLAGKPYFVDQKTGIVVPLDAKKLDTNDVNEIINGLIYQATAENKLDENRYFREDFIPHILNWGIKKNIKDFNLSNDDKINKNYIIYFEKGNQEVIKYGLINSYNEDGSPNYKVDTIDIKDLIAKNEKYDKFFEFLGNRYTQFNKSELHKKNDKGEIKPFRIKTYSENGESGWINDKEGYVHYIVNNGSLTSKMETKGQLKQQWKGGYLRLGNIKTELKPVVTIPVKDKIETLPKTDVTVFDKDADIKNKNSDILAQAQQEILDAINGKTEESVKNNERQQTIAEITSDLGFGSFETLIGKDGATIETVENNLIDLPIKEDTSNFLPPDPELSRIAKEQNKENKKNFHLLYSEEISTQPKITEQELEIAKARFEKYGLAFDKVKGLINNRAFGQFIKSGRVLISDNAPIGTEYHEEFHVVEQLYFSDDNRKNLYQEYRNTYDKQNATNEEVSEALAEMFRYYSINKKLKDKPSNIISELFRKLLDFITNLTNFTKSKKIEGLFEAISNDVFLQKNIENPLDNKLNVAEKDQLVKSLTYNYFNSLNKGLSFNGKSIPSFNNIEMFTKMKSVAEKLARDTFKDEKNFENLSGSEIIAQLVFIDIIGKTEPNIRKKIIKNSKEVYKLFTNNLEKYNYLNELEEVDETDRLSLNYSDLKNSSENDFAGNANKRVKLFLSGILNPIKNKIGLDHHIDLDTVIKQLHTDTVDIESTSELKEVLLKGDEVYREIYKQLYQTNINVSDQIVKIGVENFRNEFLNQFAKTRNTYYTNELKKEDGVTKFIRNNENKDANLKETLEKNKSAFALKLSKKEILLTPEYIQSLIDRKLNINNVLITLEELGFNFSDLLKPNKQLNDNQLDALLRKEGVDVGLLKDKTKYLLQGLQKQPINIFDKNFKYKSDVKSLVELDYNLQGIENRNASILTADGKSQYAIQEHNTLSKLIKTLKNTFKTLKLNVLNGQKTNDEGVYSEGITTNQLSESDMFISYINNIFNGDIPYIFPGSKSMTYAISGFRDMKDDSIDYIKSYTKLLENEIQKSKEAYQLYLKAQTDNSIQLIENYHIKKGGVRGDGTKLRIFENILSKDHLQLINNHIDNNTDIKLSKFNIKKDIELHITSKISEWKEFMINNNIIDSKGGTLIINGIDEAKLSIYSLKGINEANETTKYQLDRLIKDIIVHTELSLNDQIDNITGNLAYYKDPLKRFTGIMGTKKNMNLDSDFITIYNTDLKHKNTQWNYEKYPFGRMLRTMIVNDIVFNDDVLNKEFDNAYSEINVTDAQGYESLDMFRFRKISQGEWSDAHTEAYESELTGKPLTEYQKALVSEKTQYFGRQIVNGEEIPVFYKMSVFVPSLFKDTNLSKVGEQMNKQGVGILLFNSGNKVGRIVNNQGIGQDLFTDETVNEFEEKYIQTIDLRYYGTQLDVHQEKGTSQTHGTQADKLITVDLLERFSEEEVKIVHDNFDKLVIARTNTELVNLKNKIGLIEKEDGSFDFKDSSIVSDILTEESKRRDLPFNFTEGIKTLLNTGRSLDIVPRKAKLESILTSLVNSKAIKYKVHGDSKVQVSSAGFEKNQIGKSTNLNFYELDEEGNTFGMEVYLPSYLKNSANLDQKIKLTGDKNDPLLQVIGFRIPTQGLNSIEFITVKGFLPESAGNMIVVPKQITTKSGSDFDIDKMNLYFPNFYSEKGKDIYIKGYENEEQFSKEYEKYLGVKDIDRNNNYQDNLKLIADTNKKLSYNQFKIKAIDNAILKQYIDIVKDKRNRKAILTPNTDVDIKSIAYKIRNLKGKAKESRKDIVNLLYLVKRKISFEAGKSILGIVALHNTHHAESQKAGLKLDSELYNKPNFKSYKNGEGKLDLIRNFEGKLISDVLSQNINATVDVEKDDYIKDFNLSLDTASTYLYMIRLGIPLKDVMYFLSQPSIVEYTRRNDLYNSQQYKLAHESLSKTEIVKKIKEELLIDKDLKPLSTFTEENLIKSINDDYTSQKQQIILNEFFKYKKDADVLSDFMRSTTFDTKGLGTSLIQNKLSELKYNNFMKADDSKLLLNKENFFNRDGQLTKLGNFRNTVFEANKYFNSLFRLEEQFNTLNIPFINNILNSKKSEQDIVKTANKIKNELLNYIVQNLNNDKISYKLDYLTTGSTSVAVKVNTLQKSNVLNNYFIDNVVPIITEDRNGLALLNAGNIDVERSNKLTEGFLELYEINPILAVEIVELNILNHGFGNSPTTLNNIIPTDIMLEVIESYYQKDLKIDAVEFEHLLSYNNANDNDIVPISSNFGKLYFRKGYNFTKTFGKKGIIKLYKKGVKEPFIINKKINFKNYDNHQIIKTTPLTEGEKTQSIIEKLGLTKCY